MEQSQSAEEIEQFIEENEAMVKFITTVAVMQATPAVIAIYEKRKAAINKEEGRKRISNTKKLLRHYRELKLYGDALDGKITASVSTLMPEDEKEQLIKMLEFSDDIVESIKESTQKTILMLQKIETGMKTLGIIYKQEKNDRTFNIIKDYRIDGMKKVDVANKYGINPRTVEKTEVRVAERLSILLFGIYGIKLE